MSTYLETRIQRLELEALEQRRTIRQLLGRLADVAQSARVVQGGFGPGGGGGEAGDPVRRAKVTTAIPTGTLASPSSSGKVKLQKRNADGSWSDGDEVTCLNDFTMPASLPVGRVAKVAKIAGDWWLVSASCS